MTFVYLIEAQNGLVKVGVGQKVGDRFTATRTHSPVLVRLIAAWPGTPKDEAALHVKFAAYRSHGEWFRLEGNFARFVDEWRGHNMPDIPEWDELLFESRSALTIRRKQVGAYARLDARLHEAIAPHRSSSRQARTRVPATRRQSELLSFAAAFIAKNGYPPTFDEMRLGLGYASKSGVHRIIAALISRQLVSYEPGRARSLSLLTQANENGVAA